jgi:hypothetical protein
MPECSIFSAKPIGPPPCSVRTAAVEFGESTSAILTELGYSQEELMSYQKNSTSLTLGTQTAFDF